MIDKQKTELYSTNSYAKSFLKLGDKALPTKLHNALNTVFTKTHSNDDKDQYAFRKKVIRVSKNDLDKTSYRVLEGRSNAIYNALCLIAVFGVGPTKKIFQYAGTQKKEDLPLLVQTQEQSLIFFCLGVHMDNISKIITTLESGFFDLFTERLPSPFGYNLDDKFNLAPMIVFYESKIPWQDYVSRYQAAKLSYATKDVEGAILQLEELELDALLPLPAVTSLKETIIAKETDAEEASNYLQSLLNYK